MTVLDVVIQLLENFSFVLVIVYIYGVVRKHFEKYPFHFHAGFIGFIFGCIALLSMQRPIQISEGIIIDARVILVTLSGYFGGPIAAALSAIMVSSYRAMLGGVGMVAGIVSIVFGAILGSVFFLNKSKVKNEIRGLLLLGILAALFALSSSFVLPYQYIYSSITKFFVPVIIIYPLGTVIYGRVILGVQRKYYMETELVNINSELAEEVRLRATQVEEINKGLEEEIEMRTSTEMALKIAEQEANEANRMKSDFIANMSHEIRTPLNAIIGYNHLLDKTELDEKQKNYVAKMASSSSNLLSIVNDILDFSKIEAGKVDVYIKSVNLYGLINKIVDTTSYESLRKELSLKISVTDKVPEWINSDESHLSQMILNITSNAVKFTNSGSVTISVDVVEYLKKPYIEFIVTDTGIGVNKAQLKTIFNAFTQANMSINREYGGTGLGLAITKKLVDAMGGYINFDSTLGEGSTVTLAIPYEKSNQKVHRFDSIINVAILTNQMDVYRSFYNQLTKMGVTLRTLSTIDQLHQEDYVDYVLVDWNQKFSDHQTLIKLLSERVKEDTPIDIISYERNWQIQRFLEERTANRVLFLPSSANNIKRHMSAKHDVEMAYTLEQHYHMQSISGKQILIVEDNLLNQDIERSILEEKGGIVTLADNGEVAVQLVKENQYDMILMDIHMPVMGGYDAAYEIRSLPKGRRIPIIAMTADVQVEVKGKVTEAGMNDYIKKPIDVMEVYKVLAKYL